MEDQRIRLIALIAVNLIVILIAREWVHGNPDSLAKLLAGYQSN